MVPSSVPSVTTVQQWERTSDKIDEDFLVGKKFLGFECSSDQG